MRALSRPDGPIAFLLGKPVRGESVFSEVLDRLQQHGREVRVHLPHEAGPMRRCSFIVASMRRRWLP